MDVNLCIPWMCQPQEKSCFSTTSRGPILRIRDILYGIYNGACGFFESRKVLKTFLRGGPRIRPGKGFYGPKTDVYRQNKTVRKKKNGYKFDVFHKSTSKEMNESIGKSMKF